MTIEKLIKILKQFDPERRVVIQTGNAVLEPKDIRPLAPSPVENRYYCTDAELGDIVVEGQSI